MDISHWSIRLRLGFGQLGGTVVYDVKNLDDARLASMP